MKRDAEVTNRNIFGAGSQGTGKSRGLIRGMIIQGAISGASMVIMDTKSELTSDCAAYLKKKGYHVVIWNLVNLWNSNGWDILGEFEDEQKIPTIVNTIINNSGDAKPGDFFNNIEAILLEALCRYVYETYPVGKRNIGEAYKLLRTKKPDELNIMFDQLRAQNPMSEAVGCYVLFSGSSSNQGNAILGLGSRLRIFNEERVREITGKADINLEDIAKKKTALFLVMSASDQTYNMLGATIITMLFDTIFKYAQSTPHQRCDIPVEFFLDEFPNVGYIDGFAQKLGVARSFDIGIHIMIQNIPQFYNRYTENMATEIMGGCNYSLYLGCNDPVTSKYFSTLMGNATQKVRSDRIESRGFLASPSGTLGDGQRPLEYEDELRRYPPDELYLQVNAKMPIKLKKFDYSRHPEALLMRKVVSTELVPEWRIVNGMDLMTGEIVEKDKVITTDEWLELVGSDSDRIPALKDSDGSEMTRLCVVDTEKYGASRSKLIAEVKELKKKYEAEGKTPNGQPLLADNPLAMVNPNGIEIKEESKAKISVVKGVLLDKGKKYKETRYADEIGNVSQRYSEEIENTSQRKATKLPKDAEKLTDEQVEKVFSEPLNPKIKDGLKTTPVNELKIKATEEDIEEMSVELKRGAIPLIKKENKKRFNK